MFDLVGSGLWWLACLAVSVSCGVDIIQFCGLLEFGVWGGAVVVSWWARVLRGFLGGWFLGCGCVGLVWVMVCCYVFWFLAGLGGFGALRFVFVLCWISGGGFPRLWLVVWVCLLVWCYDLVANGLDTGCMFLVCVLPIWLVVLVCVGWYNIRFVVVSGWFGCMWLVWGFVVGWYWLVLLCFLGLRLLRGIGII